MPVLQEEFPALYQAESCEPAPPFEEQAIDTLAFELMHESADPEEGWVGAENQRRLAATHI